MPDFEKRSYELEMLDMPIKDKRELHRNLKEISLINKLLGGDGVTIKGLKKLMKDKERKYSIVDIGCGDGGMLRRIRHWVKKNGYSAEFLGIDIEPEAIKLAREINKNIKDIRFEVVGYETYFQELETKPDIIISALFCHHLTDHQLMGLLNQMNDNCNIGFIVNDLHRHFLAYHSIKWLTQLFSRSTFTKNDAPVSVCRGFKREELNDYFRSLPNTGYEISWQWAFRYLAVAQPNTNGGL